MKLLFIHTYYQQRGGEDVVFESEVNAAEAAGYNARKLVFNNAGRSLVKLLLLPFNPFAFFKTIKTIRSFRPDVIHIHNLHFASSPSVLVACSRMKVPVVVTIHNFRLLCPSGSLFYNNEVYTGSLKAGFPWDAVRKGMFRNSKMFTFWLAFNTWLHKKAGAWKIVSKFVFLNNYARDIFVANDERRFAKSIVKPNFLADPGLSPWERTNQFLFIGRLCTEKGIDLLLKAHRGLRFKLTIIGDGPMKVMVEEHCREFTDAHYLGFQPRETVLNHLKQCSALLLPSVCMEMNPFAVIEAMACGTPVIASNIGTLEQYVTDAFNAILFKSGDAQSLNEAIDKFQSLSTEERSRLSEMGRKTYQKYFTAETHIHTAGNLYNSLYRESKLSAAIPTF